MRLLTLLGPPGVGKTRLATRAAATLLESFPDGAHFVALASITDANLVLNALAQTLHVSNAEGDDLGQAIAHLIADKQMLLVLDNFEQVTDAAIHVAELLAACPRLKIIVTSRTPLHIRGEWRFNVSPLALADLTHTAEPAALARYSAIALFVERARQVNQQLSLNPNNAYPIAALCARLDGLPLAIELIAARCEDFSPQELVARLDSHLLLSSDGIHDLPPRQRTLRNAVAWSYDRLSRTEQNFFARLGVFVGGFTLEAAEAVPAKETLDTRAALAALTDKNLVRCETDADGATRYGLLETLREFALEQLEANARERRDAQSRHADYFLAYAERMGQELGSAEQTRVMDALEIEHNNLRAALRWFIENAQAERGLRLAGALYPFWLKHGHLVEGRRWLEQCLALPVEQSVPQTVVRAQGLHAAGVFAVWQSDYEVAKARLHESIAIWRKKGDLAGQGRAYSWLGSIEMIQNNLPAAQEYFQENLERWQRVGEARGLARAYERLGYLKIVQGECAAACPLFEKALSLFRQVGDPAEIEETLEALGEAMLGQGEYAAAMTLFEERLTASRKLGHQVNVVDALFDLAHTAYHQCDYRRAGALFEESLEMCRVFASRGGIADCLAGLAGAAAATGQLERAARLCGASEKVREHARDELWVIYRQPYENALAQARAGLGDVAFETMRGRGREMNLDQLLANALLSSSQS